MSVQDIGEALVGALGRIRAGLVLAAAAFLQLSISAANESQQVPALQIFFEWVAVAFGIGAVIALAIFLFQQVRLQFRRPG